MFSNILGNVDDSGALIFSFTLSADLLIHWQPYYGFNKNRANIQSQENVFGQGLGSRSENIFR